MHYLNGAVLHGKRMNVVPSKHSTVEMPREDVSLLLSVLTPFLECVIVNAVQRMKRGYD